MKKRKHTKIKFGGRISAFSLRKMLWKQLIGDRIDISLYDCFLDCLTKELVKDLELLRNEKT